MRTGPGRRRRRDTVARSYRAHSRPRRSGGVHQPARRGRRDRRSQGADGGGRGGPPALRHSGGDQGQHRRRGTADHRRLPGLRLQARQGRHRRGAAAPGRRDRHRQDQSRPVRDRPGRRALALWHAAQRAQSGADPRRIELGLGGRGRRGPRAARARHRHRGLRTRAGGAQQHRRPEAEPRPRLDRGRGAGLPLARLRLDLRADHRRLLDGARRHRRPGRSRSLFARAPARPDRRVCARACGSACRSPASGMFFGDRAAGGRLRRGDRARGSARRADRRDRHRAVLRDRAAALRRAVGGGALHRAASRCWHRRPDAIHPVTREIIVQGARPSAVDAFAAFYKLEELRRVRDAMFRQIDALLLPTAPTAYTVEQVLADPIQLNSRLGTYTNFVNLLDLCGLAVPSSMRADGMPFGITLLAPAGHDALLASIGRVVPCRHRAAARRARRAAAAARADCAAPAADEIAIAVVGAHLSGMPLNGELKALGGAPARSHDHRARLPALCACRQQAAEAGPAARRARARAAPSRSRSGRCAPKASAASSPPSRRRCRSARCGLPTAGPSRASWSRPRRSRARATFRSFGGWRAYLAQAKVPAA